HAARRLGASGMCTATAPSIPVRYWSAKDWQRFPPPPRICGSALQPEPRCRQLLLRRLDNGEFGACQVAEHGHAAKVGIMGFVDDRAPELFGERHSCIGVLNREVGAPSGLGIRIAGD